MLKKIFIFALLAFSFTFCQAQGIADDLSLQIQLGGKQTYNPVDSTFSVPLVVSLENTGEDTMYVLQYECWTDAFFSLDSNDYKINSEFPNCYSIYEVMMEMAPGEKYCCFLEISPRDASKKHPRFLGNIIMEMDVIAFEERVGYEQVNEALLKFKNKEMTYPKIYSNELDISNASYLGWHKDSEKVNPDKDRE